MDINGYGFGVAFDKNKVCMTQNAFDIRRALLMQILSAISAKNAKNARFFSAQTDELFYLVVEYDKFFNAKCAFANVKSDEGLNLLLDDNKPYIAKNYLRDLSMEFTEEGYVNDNALLHIYNDVNGAESTIDLHVRNNYKVVLAPDSFKGSLSSHECIQLLTVAARYDNVGARIFSIPTADGGEGTINAFLAACGGERLCVNATDSLGRSIQSYYGRVNHDTAIIELAQASGLTLIDEEDRDVMHSTTYGTGEIIRQALEADCTNIIIGLGGSATNDGGMGIARALGVRFFDEYNHELLGFGEDLIRVKRIDKSAIHPYVKNSKFTVMCDVTNPFIGLNGAVMVFSPQKGADERDMFDLECGMKSLRRVIYECTNIDVGSVEGAGAAGGAAGMLYAIFGATLMSGIDALLETVHFEEHMLNTAFVVTGEGKFDMQTMNGNKAVCGIIERSSKCSVPICLIAGMFGNDVDWTDQKLKNTTAVTLTHSGISVEESIANAELLFFQAALRLFRSMWNVGLIKKYESLTWIKLRIKVKNVAIVIAKKMWLWLKVSVKYFSIYVAKFYVWTCTAIKSTIKRQHEKRNHDV